MSFVRSRYFPLIISLETETFQERGNFKRYIFGKKRKKNIGRGVLEGGEVPENIKISYIIYRSKSYLFFALGSIKAIKTSNFIFFPQEIKIIKLC